MSQAWTVTLRPEVTGKSVDVSCDFYEVEDGVLTFIRYGSYGEEFKVATFHKDVWLHISETGDEPSRRER